MKKIKINFYPVKSGSAGAKQFNGVNKITPEQIDLIVSALKKGKVVAMPSDTIYGLSCLATSKRAIKKIRQIKKMPANKPLLVLVSSLAMAKKYCRINKKQEKYLMKVWQNLTPALSLVRRGGIRSITVILASKKNLPQELTGGEISLAVRLPKSDFLIKIIREVGQPIVSTSLNVSGEKPLNNIFGLENYFKKIKPDLAIDAGKIKKDRPSKLVDLRDMTQIKILRK